MSDLGDNVMNAGQLMNRLDAQIQVARASIKDAVRGFLVSRCHDQWDVHGFMDQNQ